MPLLLFLLVGLLGMPVFPTTADTAPHYETTAPSRDGIGKVYMGREISQVMGHRGARWLERSSRVREERPDRVIKAMALAADAEVADIGAGTGYFTVRLAERVPAGVVFAVDLQRRYSTSCASGSPARTSTMSSRCSGARTIRAYHPTASMRRCWSTPTTSSPIRGR